MERVIVLHSGGLDSTVALLMAVEEGLTPVSLGIDYGQRHQVELTYAEQLCQKFDVERRVLNVAWDKPVREMPMDRPVEEIRSGRSTAFLPARNIVFLSLALAEASGIGATEVWLGINAIDYSGYPDCTQDFLDSFRSIVEIAIPDGPRIRAPLIALSKPQIAEKAAELGIGPEDTWSCYRPVSTSKTIQPCGRCDACQLHKYAWEHIGRDGANSLKGAYSGAEPR